MAAQNLLLQLLISARDTASDVIGRVRAAIGGIGDAVSAGLEPLNQWKTLMGAVAGIGGAAEAIKLADAYTVLTNQIRAATKSEEEYQQALASVTAIAQGLPADLEATARLYSKVNANAGDLGLSQQQVAVTTELISKAMKLEGASANTVSGAITQLSQSLGSGVVRGDEFNSIMEASPTLMANVARGLGVATGELRTLAEAGQLTAQRFVQALLTQNQAITDAYGKLPQTVEQSMQRLNNAVLLFAGGMDQQAGITSKASAALGFLADNLGLVANVMGAALATAIAKSVQSTGEYVAAALAARSAAQQQAAASAQQQAATLAAAEAQVVAAQAALNRARAEQAATVAQLAALESLTGLFASEEALTLARSQASAAATAAAAATQRLAAAQTVLTEAQAVGAASAGLLSRAMGFLAGPAGLILTAVASFGLLFAATSKQKPAMEALAQSTDEYANTLRRMTAAQLAAAQLSLSEEIANQQREVRNAADAASEYATYLDYLTGASITAKRGEEERTRALAELDTQTQKLNDLENRRLMVTQAQSELTIRAKQADDQHAAALLLQVTAMDKLQLALESRGKAQQELASAEIAATEAALKQAQADDDANKIGEQTLKLAQQRVAAAQQQAVIAETEAAAAQEKATALGQVTDSTRALTDAERKNLLQAQEDAQLKTTRAAAAQALVQQLQAEANSTETLTAKQIKQIELAEKNTRAAQNYTSSLESVAQAQTDGIRQEIALANAKGDTWTAQQKSVELAKIEAQWAQTIAAVKQAEIAAERAEVEAKLAQKQAIEQKTEADNKEIAALQLKLQALGLQSQAVQVGQQVDAERQKQLELTSGVQQQNTQQTQQNTQAVQDNSAAQQVSVKHTQDTGAALAMLSSYLAQARGAMNDLSSAAGRYFEVILQTTLAHQGFAGSYKAAMDAQRAFTEGMDEGSAKLADLRARFFEAVDAEKQATEKLAFAMNGFRIAEAAIELAAAKTRQAYLEQASAAELLRQQLEDTGSSGANATNLLSYAAKQADQSLGLLDEQDLAGLRQAIADASARMRELQEETQTAQERLQELNAEIAAERGDDATSERLKLQLEQQQALRDVEAKLAEARAANNRDLIALYEQQEQKLNTLYDLKERNLEQDIKQKQQESKNKTASDGNATGNATTPTSHSGGGAGSSATSGGGITLNVNAPNARYLDGKIVEDLARQVVPVLTNINRRLA